MGFWQRLKLLFKVRTSAEMDRMEDPREILDYAGHEQAEFLQTVRRGLVDVATSKQQLVQQVKTMRARIPKLESQATQAVSAGRDDLARMALTRKQTALVELDGLETQLAELDMEERKLIQAEQQISDRVASFQMHREAVKARYTAAEAQVRIGETVTGVAGELGELSLALGRAEEKTRQMSARASALDALTTAGALEPVAMGDNDMIERELHRITTVNTVERELAALKSGQADPDIVELPSIAGKEPPRE